MPDNNTLVHIVLLDGQLETIMCFIKYFLVPVVIIYHFVLIWLSPHIIRFSKTISFKSKKIVGFINGK